MVEYLVSVFFLASLCPMCTSVEYYVTPTTPPITRCPLPCYTLDHYALNHSLLSNKENVSLLFLEGLHTLNQTLVIKGTSHMRWTQVQSESVVIVKCNYSDIVFEHVVHLELSNLTMYGQVKSYRNGAVPLSWLTYTSHTALLHHLTIDRFGLNLSGKSVLNHCEINNSRVNLDVWDNLSSLTFYKSNLLECKIQNERNVKDLELVIIGCTIHGHLGGKYCHYGETIEFEIGPAGNVSIEVVDSWFDGQLVLTGIQQRNNISLSICRSEINNSCFDNTVRVELGHHAKNNSVQIEITDSKIFNTKDYGLGVVVDVTFTNTVEILLRNTSLNNHEYEGAIQVKDNLQTMEQSAVKRSLEGKTLITIAIANCIFFKNKIAVEIIVQDKSNTRLEMLITGSTFFENENALDIRKTSLMSQTTFTSYLFVSLTNITIKNNYPPLDTSGVLHLVDVDMLNLRDCRFVNNQGTALESYFSTITLAGNTTFKNNTSTKGGAMVLFESYMYVRVSSNTFFYDNYAHDVGGAIYLKQRPYFKSDIYDRPPCFYQVRSILDSPNLSLNFKGNLACNGGDDIYGGSLYTLCRPLNSKFTFDTSLRDKMFHFQDKTLSSITSDPTRVCLCDDQGTPQCANMEYIYRDLPPRYPGEMFTVTAVVVGSDLGTVPGIIHSKVSANNSYTMYLQVQEIRDHRECGLLNFSIQSQLTNTTHELQLYVYENTKQKEKSAVQTSAQSFTKYKQLFDSLLSQHIYISFTLQDCPTGFTLRTTHPFICTCHPILENNGVTVCIITNHTGWVFRSGTIWVSDSFNGYQANSFVLHHYCPYDYCKQGNTSVDLKFPDTQCMFKHSGILCGGCYGNLSLALGTSRCLACDNRYISLLILFIFAGFALVFFIKVLDLTVAKGTINGLIFYSNIVWANKSIVFQNTETFHPAQQILHTFIPWLNLDLGIETCFINGLNAYWKTWLQFVFPLYVWMITGVVIIASHYNIRASKIFGNNSVPVLATLIFLSYAKLLRTIITSLGFSLLDYPEGTRVVWSFDGNVPYFGAAHTILFLVALAALLLLWLPYTTVLLTLQWLRRKSYVKPLRWINRWKPFFDAYFGQLKPKHHYWVGLMLLVRVVLLVLFAGTSAVVPKLNILAMVITGLLLLAKQIYTGSMYKLILLSILENSFIVNLTLLGVVKLYMLPTNPGHTAVIFTSIGVVFVEFLAIVIYHTWSRLKSTYLTYKRRHREGENTTTDRELRVVTVIPHNRMHYREPLLDSCEED